MTGIRARFRLVHAAFSLDVDLRLPGRGVIAIFGPSGAGKTTFLRCLAGLTPKAQGLLRVNGQTWQDTARRIDVPTHRRPLGYVFQEASLFAHLDVLGNLRFGMQRVSAAQRRVSMDQAVALLGIAPLLRRMPAGLSGGERQRVAIARALLTSPSLLLMDEPLVALDFKRKQEVLPYLERLHDALEIPLVYVSHSLEEVARLADYLVLLDAGRATASGPIGETLARLDLPLAMEDEAAVVVQGRVEAFDADYGILSLRLLAGASCLHLAHPALPVGCAMRVTVKARDVSLALSRSADSSILNVIPARVTGMAPVANAAHLMVRLDADGTPLLARITRYSRDVLALSPGARVWAQIKAVSLLA